MNQDDAGQGKDGAQQPHRPRRVDSEATESSPEVLEAGSSPHLPARLSDGLPPVLPVLVSHMGPIFPGMMSPVPLADPRARATAEGVGTFVGLLAARAEAEGHEGLPTPRMLYEVGVVARVVQRLDGSDGDPALVVASSRRMHVRRWIKADTVLLAEVDYPDDVVHDQTEVDALLLRARQSFKELLSLTPDVPDEMKRMADDLRDPGPFCDFVAFNLSKDLETKQGVLASFELDSRLRTVLLLIEKELELTRLGAKLRDEIRSTIEQRQKEHYLREQMQAIRRELGEEVDQRELDLETYKKKIEAARMPEQALAQAERELKRLSMLPTEAADYHVLRGYLDWLVELPWSKLSDERLDVNKAARILEQDHYGLEEVKERIVEFLAVRKLNPGRQAAILCLVGPPGVGKTSLGQSVARATGREFYRVSLGGMRDEAEIKGHRRTYVGAMPGKILQGLRRVGTRNPVFMLDELDKLSSDWRGDPASALLEVLDPAQNSAFEDLYLDLPFDLSQVMFIATANVMSQIPAPLLDRTELITLSGYIPQEKQAIGRRYLLPRQLEHHGLKPANLKLTQKGLSAMVQGYTREAGVRGLERMIGRVCRKVAARVAALPEGQTPEREVVTDENLHEYLGPRRHNVELLRRCKRPGVVVGLAWTPVGGEVLFIEASAMPGRGSLKLTGKLGSVMNESAQLAYSLVRGQGERYGIPPHLLRERDIHLHVPAGAVPKDGPSAGVAMACALLSLLWRGKGRVARARVAMTGEITLRGQVLPVGGIREKVVGAKLAGVKTIIVPRQNQADVEQIDAKVRRGTRFIYADEIDDVVQAAIAPLPRS